MRTVGVLVAALPLAHAGSGFPDSAFARAQAQLNTMQLADKLGLLRGYAGGFVGDVPSIAGLPPINLEDGPQGVADGVTQVTAWPSALTVTQTWDRNAIYAFGQAMAQEQRAKGTNVMLGPGVNLARTPWCGRNFEYMGEDPYLASQLVAPLVQGIQSQNISGCVKHYTGNEIEADRSGMNSMIDTATWMNTYSRPFQAAIDAGVGTLMCSYNRITLGSGATAWACENSDTLGYLYDPARGNFSGWTMSDWGATHSTVPSVTAGLTQQMPDDSFYGAALAEAVASGAVSESTIDTMAMRILVPVYALGLVDNPPTGSLAANVSSLGHDTLARTLAEQSTVLLKNDGGLLPIDPSSIKSVLVLGDQSTVTGHGSGGVVLPYTTTPYSGIATFLNGPLPPRPVNCTFFNDTDYYQPGNPCVAATSAQDCCAQCTATASCSAFTYVAGSVCAEAPTSGRGLRRVHKHNAVAAYSASTGACWLKPDTSGYTPAPGKVAGVCAAWPPSGGAFKVDLNETQDAGTAAALAAGYDVVIMNVATTSGEGSDRPNLDLPDWQNAMVTAVLAANKNTVVVARCPGACTMPWADAAPSILFQLLPGQEAGNALANAVFGSVNPSGKLPLSFPASMNDTWLGDPVNPAQYPGVVLPGTDYPSANYSEGVFFGYRWYDQQGTAPLWPFGHGLSYTSFGYSNAKATPLTPTADATITFTLTNTGAVAGAEVAQLYVGWPAPATTGQPMPVRQLRGFEKVQLQPGGSEEVVFSLAAADLQVWSESTGWAVVPGVYSFWVGSSSRDLRLTGTFAVSL